MEDSIKVDYQAEVLKIYPDATAKHWAYDNGHGNSSFWSISKENICITYTPDRYISGQRKTAKEAWKSAYQNITPKTNNNGNELTPHISFEQAIDEVSAL